MNCYETPALVHQYLLFHYGTAEQQLPQGWGLAHALDYPVRCVRECLAPVLPREPRGRALDLGCSVGRAAFELSAFYEEVRGIDLSRAFIQAAQEMQKTGRSVVKSHEEGHRYSQHELRLPSHVRGERVQFAVGDALDLPSELGTFDCVLAANLIDRLPSPGRFLRRLPSLLNAGGYALLLSPYTWLEEFTPKAEWPEGSTQEFLVQQLGESLELVETRQVPFLIREHARKYQFSVAESTLWRKA